MGKFCYKEICESEVDPHKLREAKRVLKLCKNFLCLPGLRIQWCKEIDKKACGGSDEGPFKELFESLRALAGYKKHSEEFYGMVKVISQQDKILIRADLPLVEIKKSIAHECKHHSDFRDYGFFNVNEEEKRADNFVREILRKLEV